MKILLLTMLLLVSNLLANIGKVTAIKGDVSITRDTKILPVTLGFIIEEKDQIKTAENARLQLQFNDKTIISLGKDSVFNVEEYFFDEKQPQKTKASFKMAKGIFKSITGRIGKINPNKFKLKTKSASIGIRGTVFLGQVTPGAPDSIACTTGRIVVSTPDGFVEVPAGQFTTVVPGQAPQKPTKLPKSKANSLENGSGASANEQESGQNEQTVEKQKSSPIVTDGAPQGGGGDTPPIDDPDPILPPETPAVDPNDVTDPTNDPANNPPLTNTYKTATYKVFQSANFTPKDSALNSSSFSEVLQTPTTFNITEGVLSGNSQLHGIGIDTYPIYDIDSNLVVTTYTLPTITIDNPSSSYSQYGMIYNNTTNGITEQIYTDDKQEFFVGTKKYTETLDGIEYEYIQNTVFGEVSSSNTLPSDGISHYTDIETRGTDSLINTSGSYIYWKNRSMLSYELQNDGKFFLLMGQVQADEYDNAKIDLQFIERDPVKSENFSSIPGTDEFYLFGSENQGWGGSITAQNESAEQITHTHGEFKNIDIITNNATVNTTFTGLISTDSTIDNQLSLTVDSTSGINGNINATEINFSGTYNSSTAAYINNDLFATIGFSGNYNGTTVNDGWLIAIDSGSLYDDNSDDGISWGFWDVDVSNVEEYGEKAWVATQNTVDDMASLNFSTATYSGQAMGFLTETNNVTTYIDPSKSTMNLDFDFGANTINATLNINNSQAIISTTFEATTLAEGSVYNATHLNDAQETSLMAGSFSNGGGTTFGTFDFVDTANGIEKASGAYKANLTESTASNAQTP